MSYMECQRCGNYAETIMWSPEYYVCLKCMQELMDEDSQSDWDFISEEDEAD